uniref:Beta-ketoacyl synthase N-terminal domain-containing protein n=1 Tax=Timema douglasi TaxID=61478 RepID=A0A7R8ZDP7_TIMDO|nr:unnamed protein product [Timema douglasi]
MMATRLIMPEGNHTEISDEDVVISGIAGSFPEAINTDELKEKLFDNAEFIKICEYSNWGKGASPFVTWHLATMSQTMCGASYDVVGVETSAARCETLRQNVSS